MSEIHEGYVPGALGRIIELHEIYYEECWNLNYKCIQEIAADLTEFLGRYDEADNRLWLVMSEPDDGSDQEIMGSLVVDDGHDDEEGARIRCVILEPEFHGQGLGRELMDRAMAFCEAKNFDRVYLWTFEGLEAARHLYEEHGFTLSEENIRNDWGPEITYQRFDVEL